MSRGYLVVGLLALGACAGQRGGAAAGDPTATREAQTNCGSNWYGFILENPKLRGFPVDGLTVQVNVVGAGGPLRTRDVEPDSSRRFGVALCPGQTAFFQIKQVGPGVLYQPLLGGITSKSADVAEAKVFTDPERVSRVTVVRQHGQDGDFGAVQGFLAQPNDLGSVLLASRSERNPKRLLEPCEAFLTAYKLQDPLFEEMSGRCARAKEQVAKLEVATQQEAERRHQEEQQAAQEERDKEVARQAAVAERQEFATRQCGGEILSQRDFVAGKNPFADKGKCVEFTAKTVQMTGVATGLFDIGDSSPVFVQFAGTFRGPAVKAIARVEGLYPYTTTDGRNVSVPKLRVVKLVKAWK